MKIFYKDIKIPEDVKIHMPYAKSKFVKAYIRVEKGDELHKAGYSENLTFEVPGKQILIEASEPYFIKECEERIKEFIKNKIDKE